jgi:Zn-dependent oligopeptidase
MSKKITGNINITLDFEANPYEPRIIVQTDNFDCESEIFKDLKHVLEVAEDFTCLTGKRSKKLDRLISDLASSFASDGHEQNSITNYTIEVSLLLSKFINDLYDIQINNKTLIDKHVRKDGLPY